ncbi:coiled-coil domain-containing protein [Caldicellulosiruptor naganoensis]|uniref:DUF881 domain-containing protein n=1 Tax=Caldicellulosiruptor naganoensis TaxID=29324 RepID=A0ABY7BIF9_9FIRM|nr:hypothetical protein [Caldicellulosiruptor naganoensis]WAM32285.1 hypothetical protein OTJ99_000812 [Caldicellulosiruptor naganoensis]
MEKERRRWYKKGLNLTIVAIVLLAIGSGVIFASNQSIDKDALITYGFFKKQIDQLESYINSRINELNTKINKVSNTTSNNAEVAQLQKQLSTLTLELEKLKKQVSDLETKIKGQNQAQGQSKSGFTSTKGYEVIKLPKGKVIVFDASTEFIVRVGKAISIVPKGTSIIDLTAAKDIGNGVQLPANHLLLVVKGDGRGFKAVNDVWVIVNGGYKIK